MSDEYELLDSGECKKLERFGPYTLTRPSPQAVWKSTLPEALWQKADGHFVREKGERWNFSTKIPSEWIITIDSIRFLIKPTEFGHLGIFPEQRPLWNKIRSLIRASKRENIQVLNLFAYSGGSTLAAALAGAAVCHLDAAKGMVDWARKNAELNNLKNAPIRWIVDDAMKFLHREVKRGKRYDAIILDPPTFGRGANGELFKIESDILDLLKLCKKLISDQPLFMLLSCHTAGFTSDTLQYLLEDCGMKGEVETGELILQGACTRKIPNGNWAMIR